MAYGDLPIDAPLKPNKGLEGGACNRQRCQAEPALWWNHGSHSWYCEQCAIDIGQDPVNLRDWNLRHRPDCGHAMFETREQIDARQAGAAFVAAAEVEMGLDWSPPPVEIGAIQAGKTAALEERRYHIIPAMGSRQQRRAAERAERKRQKRR